MDARKKLDRLYLLALVLWWVGIVVLGGSAVVAAVWGPWIGLLGLVPLALLALGCELCVRTLERAHRRPIWDRRP